MHRLILACVGSQHPAAFLETVPRVSGIVSGAGWQLLCMSFDDETPHVASSVLVFPKNWYARAFASSSMTGQPGLSIALYGQFLCSDGGMRAKTLQKFVDTGVPSIVLDMCLSVQDWIVMHAAEGSPLPPPAQMITRNLGEDALKLHALSAIPL